MGGSVALAARRGNVITDGQQCAPLFRKSRIRISEYRQDPTRPTKLIATSTAPPPRSARQTISFAP